MKSKSWLILFIADAITDLLCIYFGRNEIRYITKPLLAAFLFIYCIAATKKKNKIIFLLLPALFCSCAGDVFLLFEDKAPNWFIFGLISFLVAHIFYIILFVRIKKQNQPQRKLNIFMVLLVTAYTSFLFLLLLPSLGDLKIPLLIYASVLSLMVLASLHAFDLSQQLFGRLCTLGAVFFLISDSLLAINKFYRPFGAANILTMLTYVSAQFLIVAGTTEYVNFNKTT